MLDTECQNSRCKRTKNLWLYPPTGEMFCWPHYRMREKRGGQYRGRKEHFSWAVEISRLLHQKFQLIYDGGLDYPPDLHQLHREVSSELLLKLGKR